MATMYIEIDEATAEAVRQTAKQTGKTPEKVVGEAVAERFGPTPASSPPSSNPNAWVKEVLESARNSNLHSGGWKFNREEIYDR